MAGQFPIQYSEKIPSVRTPSGGETGGLALARAYGQQGAALTGLGTDVFKMALSIQKQEDAAEFSELKRKVDETGYAAFRAATGDEAADNAIWKKFEEDISSITSKRDNVNNMLREHINEVYPEWQDTFIKKGLAIRRKNVKDKFELESENLLGQGNMADYYKLLHTRLALNDISQAEFDFKAANAPNDSLLQQMRMAIGNGQIQQALNLATQIKGASADQMDYRDKLIKMANQQAAINTDTVQNEITFGMFENRDATLPERETLGRQYITKLQETQGLSAENARVMTNRIEKWMAGQERIHDSIVYTQLFRKVNQLHRGIGEVASIRREITANFDKLDDQHFESLNKDLEKIIEDWNADVLRRLEKEAIPHLAPRLSMMERFMEMSAMATTTAEKAKYDSFVQKLQEPAKLDADRLALFLDRCRKWIDKYPDATDFYEQGRYILGKFEKYTDEQIRQMEQQLESGAFLTPTTTEKSWKYIAVKKDTGERLGSDDGVTWQKIQ